MALPQWHSVLSGSEELAALGFRFLPADAEVSEDAQIRAGDIGEFGAAIGRGIGLILRAGEPDVRVVCQHADFRRLRPPLGVIPSDDPDDPEAAIDDVVEIERRLDYPAEPALSSVAEILAGLEKDHWPANDQLPDDLPYDVIGAIASMGVQLPSAATQKEWLDEGDESTLISQYFAHAGNDMLSGEEKAGRLRELVTPYLQSPHESFRTLIERIVEQHQLTD
jgi:hypothetical protein